MCKPMDTCACRWICVDTVAYESTRCFKYPWDQAVPRQNMRGLARPGSIRLLQGYCPLCYKGTPGKSGVCWVKPDDERIDAEQVALSKGGNGLPQLDLTSPGEPCQHSTMCRLNCLVCGKSMMDGDESGFEPLLELLDDLESKAQEHMEQVAAGDQLPILAAAMEKKMKQSRKKALGRYRLAWIDRWGKPVHARCSKETPCQCVVPVGASICQTHQRRLPTPRPVTKAVESVQVSMPIPAPKTVAPAAPSKPPVFSGASLSKATWLQKPSNIANTASQFRAVAEPVHKKPKPLPPKPNPRMEAAAKTCQKLTKGSWVPQEAKTDPRPSPVLDEHGEKEYDIAAHERMFVMGEHGRFMRNGAWYFRRPDGVVIDAFEGPAQFTKTGRLIPG